jgi:hypothetical protein
MKWIAGSPREALGAGGRLGGTCPRTLYIGASANVRF